MARRVLDPSFTQGRRVYWVLALDYAGRDFHLSTSTLTIMLDDGTPIQTSDALGEIAWEEAVERFSDSPGEDAIPFEVVVPDVDWSALVAAGHDLSAATGELSRYVEGTTWEERERVLTGRVDEPTYGALGEPLRFSLVSAPFLDRSVIIPSDNVVDSVSWPVSGASQHRPPACEGLRYPFVFGVPGYFSEAPTDYTPATPGYVVFYSDITLKATLLIAGHWVGATTVYVQRSDAVDWIACTVVNGYDGRGRRIAYVELDIVARTSSGALLIGVSGEFDPDVDDPAGYKVSWLGGGGFQYKGHALEQGGELLEYMLNRTSLAVDRGRTAVAAALLNGFRFSGYVDDPMSIWDWLRDNLIPLLPISIVSGPDGLYPAVWKHDPSAGEAVDVLSADLFQVSREGEVAYAPEGDVANVITIAYGRDIGSGTYRRSITALGSDESGPDSQLILGRNRMRLSVLRKSFSRYGAVVLDPPIESDIVYDAQTAAGILGWLAFRYALKGKSYEYVVDENHRDYEPEDLVLFTDSEIDMADVLVRIENVSDRDDGLSGLTVRTVER